MTLQPSSRILSIDVLRGFVMLIMLFVNDLATVVGNIVPDWMVHFSDRAKGNGMTFVDLVLPGFIFIVGMSIPLAITTSRQRGASCFAIAQHVMLRTLALLFLGVMSVHGWPSSELMHGSASLWELLMYLAAIFAFCTIAPKHASTFSRNIWFGVTIAMRIMGFIGLALLAFRYVGKHGEHIITLSPLHVSTQWWGILGIIGWSYLTASLAYLSFGNHRTALLGCMALLFCLFPAVKNSVSNSFWLTDFVNIAALSSHAAIAVAGVILSTILLTPDTKTLGSRCKFTLLFIVAMVIGALLLHGLYGLSKNHATPSWALWSCAITGCLWLCFYLICDIKPVPWIRGTLAIAGSNVLLAYLLSGLYPALLIYGGLGEWYQHLAQPNILHAVLRAGGASVIVLSITAALNRMGFCLKL